MAYKTGIDRNQSFFFNLEDKIPEDSDVRVIDAFVNSLDMDKYNFKYSSPKSNGNRPFNPSDLLKLFLFGYKQGIRSSRKLMYQTLYNFEYIWLINGINPNFRTISDFRKDNINILKNIMFQFNIDCKQLGIISNSTSQDGTKVKAVNSKEKNFTLNKIDDRKKRIQAHIDEYMETYELTEHAEDLQQQINELQNRLDTLNSYEKEMIKNNVTQKSLTDSESKLMRDNGKFSVSYNNQVLVDTNSHIVQNFEVTTNPADLGSIHNVSKEAKDIYEFDVISNTTDKGYNDRNDMINCLFDGIIPNVTPLKQNDSFNLETDFEDCQITDEMLDSSNEEDIKKCLKSGNIPNIYKDYITSIEVKECTTYENIDDTNTSTNLDLSDDSLRDFAINNKCFTRNIENNKVFCPMGEILRKKSNHYNGIKFCNKLACKNCKNPCCNADFKEIVFSNNQIFSFPNSSDKSSKKNINNLTNLKKRKKKIVKKVFIKFTPNKILLKSRMATSEHPHASMKFWDNSRYMLLKGKKKVSGELALYYCAYNIRRASNILGKKKLIEYFKEKTYNLSLKKEEILYFFPNYNNISFFSNCLTFFQKNFQKVLFFIF